MNLKTSYSREQVKEIIKGFIEEIIEVEKQRDELIGALAEQRCSKTKGNREKECKIIRKEFNIE